MNKLDLTKMYRTYYRATEKPQVLVFDAVDYVAILGKGDPDNESFSKTVEALYSVVYAIKFNCKAQDKDFVVPKLEGLWWYDMDKYPDKGMSDAMVEVPRNEWEYRLLIRLPDYVDEVLLNKVKREVIEKKEIKLVEEVHFFTLQEGKCVQMLHVGAFSDELRSLEQIVAFCNQERLLRNGLHHEIYLSDFRRVPSERLKTILREPVK